MLETNENNPRDGDKVIRPLDGDPIAGRERRILIGPRYESPAGGIEYNSESPRHPLEAFTKMSRQVDFNYSQEQNYATAVLTSGIVFAVAEMFIETRILQHAYNAIDIRFFTTSMAMGAIVGAVLGCRSSLR